MKKLYFYGAATIFILLVVGGIANYSKISFFHLKCDTLAITSNVQEQLTFKVPRDKIYSFNDVIISYFINNGFSFQSSENPNYISPPDDSGKQNIFLNVKTIGCNYQTVVWSENVISESSVLVTIHKTWLGGNKSTARVASELREQLRGDVVTP